MESWSFDTRGPEAMRRIGAALGRSIGAEGLVIALVGPLGAGKTVFVKGLAEGLGVDPRLVSSPTFVIAQQYPLPQGPTTLHHIDLYRLESEAELEGIGFDDMFARGSVLAAEWADRFPGALGRRVLRVELEGPSAAEEEAQREGVPLPGRKARVTAEGELARSVLQDWAARVADEARGGDTVDESRRGGGGADTALRSPVEAPWVLFAWLAIGLWLATVMSDALEAGWLQASDRAAGCERLHSTEEDALGTRRAACVSGMSPTESGLSGIARWLNGETLDLNRVSAARLEALSGIGPVRARAIVDTRAKRAFVSIADLERVPGIGPRTRESLASWLHVGAPPRAQSELMSPDEWLDTKRNRDG